MKTILQNVLKNLLVVIFFAWAAQARAQGTAFTYQGLLEFSNTPVSGPYDLEFQLYDSATPSSNAAVGSLLTVSNVAVSNGYFTVLLDFTNTSYAGTNYYVQISAVTNGGTNYATLSPLLPITPTPYAISAGTASTALSAAALAAGAYTNAVTFSNSANVFYGNGAGLTGVSITSNSIMTTNYTNGVAFTGDGSGLTNLQATNIVGTVTNVSFPSTFTNAVVLTNANNNFAGNGSNLVNLNAANITSGTVPVTNLPIATSSSLGVVEPDNSTITINGSGVISAVVSGGGGSPLGANNTWTGINIFTNTVIATNGASNEFAGAFYGDGNGLTNLNASNLTSGSLSPALIPWATTSSFGVVEADGSTIGVNNGVISVIGGGGGGAPLSGTNTWTGTNIFTDTVIATNGVSNEFAGAFTGTFSGDGSGVTNLSASYLSGPLPVLNGGSLTNLQTTNLIGDIQGGNLSGNYNNVVVFSNAADQFYGSGAGLSNLAYWSLTGNAGTSTNSNFIGTTDNQAFQIYANGQRVALFDGTFDSIVPNIIFGAGPNGDVNSVSNGVRGATISGGESIFIASDHSTIAGGHENYIYSGSDESVISGGHNNFVEAGSESSVIAGGDWNEIDAGGYASTIGGGLYNYVGANISHGVIPGGDHNEVLANYGFAAGNQAEATNAGAFVWADSQNAPFASTNNDSFNVRAQGGISFVTSGAGETVDGPVYADSFQGGAFSGNGGGLTNLLLTNPAPSLPASFGAMVFANNYTNVWNRPAFVSVQITNYLSGVIDDSFNLYSTNAILFPSVEISLYSGYDFSYVRDFMLPPGWWFSVANNDGGDSGIATNYVILQ